ncbi:MAG: M50 family metallopeptidase, partial [Opitutales bacterium]
MSEENLLFSESWHLVANQRVKLRANLSIRRQTFRGERWFLVGDPYRNQFYRIRPVAYYFLARLDGQKTIEEVWNESLHLDPESTPGQQEIIQALSQLYQANLLASEHPSDSAQLFARMRKRKLRSFRSQILNFLFVRVPLWDPDQFLNWLRPLAKLLVRPLFGVIWLLVLLAGVKVAIDHLDILWEQGQGLLAPGNLILLYFAWAVVKFLHECGHGIVCKRYGGEVHTMGIMFLVFMPIPYVDASSAWAFRERWRRVLVGAAGMMVEMFCAAIAAFIWVSTGPGVVNQVAYNIMFLASVSTILFNANPLLRFDGYYILSDLVDVPNLHQQSFRQQKYWLERYGFGLKRSIPPARTRGEAIGLTTFNLASTVYRLFVLTVIILFIAGQFFGLGMLVAVFAIIVWGVVPIGKFLKYLLSEPRLQRVRPRALGVVLLPVAVVVIFLAVIPFPQRFRAPGVIRGTVVADVIGRAEGTIEEMLVPPGSWVEQGTPVLVLSNETLEHQIAGIQAEMEETMARRHWAREDAPAYIEPMRVRLEATK